jgi:signal transduction histidine kinase
MRLPYRDHFGSGEATEWMPMGGAWQLANGSVYNRSDETGAKLLTGSEHWRDYNFDADLQLIGHGGDVGLTARSSDEERGADSYRGYYVGLRSQDSALIIGRADHGWTEGHPVPVNGGVHAGKWYHLQVILVGCDVGAVATNLETGQQSFNAIHETDCIREGRIGLRSLKTGAAWRHVEVRTATPSEFALIRQHISVVSQPIYPGREDEYSRMREEYFRASAMLGRDLLQTAPASSETPSASLTSIAAARTTATRKNIHIRGAVTLTSPLYVQDDSGGIAVQSSAASTLNLGDEVDVVGTVDASEPSPRLVAKVITLRGGRNLVLPLSVTSTQAAQGAVDARLVELRGTLQSKRIEGSQVLLEFTDVDQAFSAVGFRNLSLQQFHQLASGSVLRVTGICSSENVGLGGNGFSVRLRSLDDVTVLADPPWWSPHTLPRYVLLMLGLLALIFYAYLRTERRRVQAIVAERERLAYTMHDTLAQTFAGVGYHLQGVRNGLRSGTLEHDQVLEKLDVACVLVTKTHRQASEEIAALHPSHVATRDPLSMLERTLHDMLDDTGLNLVLLREGTPRELSAAAHEALFQIGRESISNVLRHAQASNITLRLTYHSRYAELEICDDGCGFAESEHSPGFGMRGMRHRAEAANGTVRVQSCCDGGSCVVARVPCARRSVRSRLSTLLETACRLVAVNR